MKEINNTQAEKYEKDAGNVGDEAVRAAIKYLCTATAK
jgi:hypothetical protein